MSSMGTGELVTLPLVSRGVALLLKAGHHTHLNIFFTDGPESLRSGAYGGRQDKPCPHCPGTQLRSTQLPKYSLHQSS